MIKKLDFTDTETITQQCVIMANKIDEVIDVINKMDSRISLIESSLNNAVSTVSDGEKWPRVVSCYGGMELYGGELKIIEANTDNSK